MALNPPKPQLDPEYLVKLDRTGSRVLDSIYLPDTYAYGISPPYYRSIGPAALAEDKDGNVLVFGGAPGPDFTAAGGGYVPPQPPAACAFQTAPPAASTL